MYLKDSRAEHPLPGSSDLPAQQDTAGEMAAAGGRREALFKLARWVHCFGSGNCLVQWSVCSLCIKDSDEILAECWAPLGTCATETYCVQLRTSVHCFFLDHLDLGFGILLEVALEFLLELMPCMTETSCPSSAVLA